MKFRFRPVLEVEKKNLNLNVIFSLMEKNLNKLAQDLKDQKLIIYGGETIHLKWIYPILSKVVDIVGFIDSNEKLLYKDFERDLSIFPPGKYRNLRILIKSW